MAAPSKGGLFRIGIGILKTIRDEVTKSILAQTGDEDGEQTDTDNVEMWYPPGYLSRPAKPEAGKQACQGIVIRQSGHDACIATRDIRGQELAGQLDDGETCVYAPGADGNGQARTIYKKDGSIFHYTRVGNSTIGAGMAMILDAPNNAVSILNGAGYGIVVNSDGVTITSGNASLTLGSDGSVRLVGTGPTQVDGSNITLGSIVTPVNTALVGPTGVSGVPSTKVRIQV